MPVYQRYLLLSVGFSLLPAYCVCSPKGPSIQERIEKAYIHVIQGNREDWRHHRKAFKSAKAKMEKLKDAKDKHRQGKAKEYFKQATLYKKLSEQNEIILNAFPKGDIAAIAAAMKEITKLEQKLTEMMTVRKPRERIWVTFDEAEQLHKDGYRFKTRDPDILPYAKGCWYFEGTNGRKTRERAAKTRKQ